jgi:hypothetical protein
MAGCSSTDGVSASPVDDVQEIYESAFSGATAEACEAVFSESPDGVLYSGDVGYEAVDCENESPWPDAWEGEIGYDDPEEDGYRDGWAQTCETFFVSAIGDDLYWGDDVTVDQYDCEGMSPY